MFVKNKFFTILKACLLRIKVEEVNGRCKILKNVNPLKHLTKISNFFGLKKYSICNKIKAKIKMFILNFETNIFDFLSNFCSYFITKGYENFESNQSSYQCHNHIFMAI